MMMPVNNGDYLLSLQYCAVVILPLRVSERQQDGSVTSSGSRFYFKYSRKEVHFVKEPNRRGVGTEATFCIFLHKTVHSMFRSL
jgi:hypothetical protein